MDEEPWQTHEIDVSPEEYFRRVKEAKDLITKKEAELKAAQQELNNLEHSSFYHRSKMRALYPRK